MKQIRKKIALLALKLPILGRYCNYWYKVLGVHKLGNSYRFSFHTLVGEYENIYLHENAEINAGCFLLAKDKIEIGENSTLAYGVTILTSANPNGPKNLLAQLYPHTTAPVTIGNDVWVGANATILPGVTIGNCSIVAAGSIVTKDVPCGVLVAGNPAVIKKQLDI